jgi:PAS domain S-box-containing protein
VAVVVAAVTLIPGPENDEPFLELIQTLSVVAAVVLVVIRQSLLMRDRESLLRIATSHATVAQRANVEANRAADESTATLARLAEAEERYRALVERLPAVVYVDAIDPSDPNARAENVYLGPQVEALTGYPSPAFKDDNDLWDSLILAEDRPMLDAQFERHGRDGTPLRVTYRLRHREGRIVWVEEHASVIGMLDSGYRLSQGVLVDVTEQRTLEEQLLAAQRMEAVGRLAGGVAHDFNNLLTAILGYASIVDAELPPGDPLREDVTAITQAAGSASSLVRQLLAFSRRQMLRPEELDLTTVVDRVVPLLRRLAGERVAFRAALADGLPGVRADPGQLEQVLVNLVVNARDAMPDGGSVTVETADVTIDEAEARTQLGLRPGHYVALTVTDTGHGMDRDVRERVFEPFFTTKEPGRGTGLGLATVYGIVKQSDGYIAVSSEPGQGASFRVLLPALPISVAPAPAPPAVPPIAEPGTERLLLVEDEETVRLLAATVLRRLGYTVELAATGAEAIRLLERAAVPFDLVVSDIVMPELGGTELAGVVRERWPDVGIVLMSGYAAGVVSRDGPIVEDAFLAKPFTPQALGSTVRSVLDQRSGRPSNASSAASVAGGSSSGRSDA